MGEDREELGTMEPDAFERMQNSWLYRFFDMACVLILMNLCIVLLSCCGLIVFGLFPAVLAAAAYGKDVLEKKDGHILRRMFEYFKQYFWIGNLQMLLTVPTIGLGFYLIYGRELSTPVYFLLFTWIILAAVLGWYLPAINVLFPEFKPTKKLVFSMVAACDRWLLTIFFLLVTLCWVYLVLLMPQLFGFVLFSGPVQLGVWSIRRALKKDGEEERELRRQKSEERRKKFGRFWNVR